MIWFALNSFGHQGHRGSQFGVPSIIVFSAEGVRHHPILDEATCATTAITDDRVMMTSKWLPEPAADHICFGKARGHGMVAG